MLHNIDPANQAPGIQTGHTLWINISHRLIMGKKTHKHILSNHEVIAYIFSMSSGPLHKSCKSSPLGENLSCTWGSIAGIDL